MLNWERFFTRHGIYWTTTGPNASRGRINIKCPWCGDGDPSEHLGVSIRHGGYSCWRGRSQGHRGKDAWRLIQALLKCSASEAQALAQDEGDVPSDEELASSFRTFAAGGLTTTRVTELRLLPEFKSLLNGSPLAEPFWTYLCEKRDYTRLQVKWLVQYYDLQYCRTGQFAGRIIFPITDRYGRLLTWTGRIIRDAQPRYKALDKEQQVLSPKDTLLGLPLLWGIDNPKVLVVTEGPFDALRFTMFGKSFGVYGTCLFGLDLSDGQMVELSRLRSRFNIKILLDAEAGWRAFGLANSGLGLDIIPADPAYKDPADMPSNAVVDLCLSLI